MRNYLIFGDSYGLARVNSPDHIVPDEECWPVLLTNNMKIPDANFYLHFEKGLKLSNVINNYSDLPSIGLNDYFIYTGGIVDFFPRVFPQRFMLSDNYYIKSVKLLSLPLQQFLFKVGLVYTWTNWVDYESFFKLISESHRGALCTIPPVAVRHDQIFPGSASFVESYNNKIINLTKEIDWNLIDLYDFFKDKNNCFSPFDGHFNLLGSHEMYSIIRNHINIVHHQ